MAGAWNSVLQDKLHAWLLKQKKGAQNKSDDGKMKAIMDAKQPDASADMKQCAHNTEEVFNNDMLKDCTQDDKPSDDKQHDEPEPEDKKPDDETEGEKSDANTDKEPTEDKKPDAKTDKDTSDDGKPEDSASDSDSSSSSSSSSLHRPESTH